MKNHIKLVLIVLSICLLFCGCSLWRDGSYVSVTPNHTAGDNYSDGKLQVASNRQMQDALTEMVEEGILEAVVYVSGMSDTQLHSAIDNAIEYATGINPIGAYAVKEITYDVGTNMGRTAVALNITYNQNRAKILQIRQAENMEDVQTLICATLDNCDSGIVLRVKDFADLDLMQLVQNYVHLYPQKCMEMPQVSVAFFPEEGKERVIEISFSYQTNRESLRAMQRSVKDVFKSAQLYINYDAENERKYIQLYTFLMERYSYTLETSITPAYSLLCHGVGDSKAFATVYAAMCRQVDLDCSVISGTRAGEAWHWNVIKVGDTYYYIDLMACHQSDGFTLKTADEMTGYVWDYSAF